MEAFLKQLNTIPEVAELAERVENGGCPVAVTGLSAVHRAQIGAAVTMAARRPAVFICGDEREAHTLTADLTALMGQRPVLLLGREWQFRPSAIASRGWEQARLATLYALAEGTAHAVVTTVDSLMARTMPPELLHRSAVRLTVGETVELKTLAERLVAAGYTRCHQVEGVGQFALRGGILDVFSPLMEEPVRCELFDDEIDSLGTFDTATQRRTRNVEEALILPAAEVLPHNAPGGLTGLAEAVTELAGRMARRKGTEELVRILREDAARLRDGVIPGGMDRYLTLIHPEAACGVDYLPENALVFLCESGRVDERVSGTLLQARQDAEALMEAGLLAGECADLMLGDGELYARLEDYPVIMMDSLPTSRLPMKPKGLLAMMAKQLSSYGGSLDTAVADMAHYRESGSAVLVLCGGETRAKNLHRLLEERQLPAVLDLKGERMPAAGEVLITIGALSAGSEYPALRLAILTEGQLTAVPRRKQVFKKESNRKKLQSYTDLSPGDLVVHVRYGIGRFSGLQKMPVNGVEKDYIRIEYAANSCLYVPVTQLDQVSKYIGGGEDAQEHVRLNKIGGTEWAKQKSKAKAAVRDLAKGLIALYAQRARQPGFAFSPDSEWQREFEESFEYAETQDQLRAVAEIKKDMERAHPMDRLLCGDVGFGKTEVALRAVMKCVLDGKQAAVLVPTTVLARQHFVTASSRFRSFPVTIEVLSRYTTPKEQKRILQALAEGQVDLVIGTHKLLQKNVKFRDLGLLVIDEEQRFGVTHKERLREMAKQVDTLTLSATPIPRTLNMALSGLRDMSTIEEPPRDRQPVQTYVIEQDWAILEDAMRRELARGGQVYYLHNRVETIDLTAGRIQKMLGPEARIVTGHGKMNEKELSAVMQAMVDGDADVLVCTTIIETGIDIPNVNTLIIEDADRMGLAQLHQIRGRVGRSARRGYAYLTYKKGKVLQETAAKRLAAVREYVEFGAGFRIAMRDLEIRGAGNLLGAEQSGYLMSVGYDLYLKLLEEAVLEEKGEQKAITRECSADISISAHIPDRYVESTEQRLDIYRRIAAIRTREDREDVLDELIDRYGEPPKSVLALLDVAMLRSEAVAVGVSEIVQRDNRLKLVLDQFRAESVLKVCNLAKYRRCLALNAGSTPSLTLTLAPGTNVLNAALALVEELKIADSEQQ